jgi:hypothetical protein
MPLDAEPLFHDAVREGHVYVDDPHQVRTLGSRMVLTADEIVCLSEKHPTKTLTRVLLSPFTYTVVASGPDMASGLWKVKGKK